MKANKKTITELVFILDNSGSMSGLERDTIGGFNSMLDKQKKLNDECYVTTILFNHEFEVLHEGIRIEDTPHITEREYYVGGMTALYDAVGMTIQRMPLYRDLPNKKKHNRKVLFVIITDGHENSSREYSQTAVKSLIEHRRSEFGWEFIFLGANIDAPSVAKDIGIDKERSANYIADSKGTELNFNILESMIYEYRKFDNISDDHLNKIRDDEKKRR